MKLKVTKAKWDDVYRDIARIPEAVRVNNKGVVISEGSVCRISVGERSAYALARGLADSTERSIQLDERIRNQLGIKIGNEYDFLLQEVGLCGRLCWACRASDPAYRLAAHLALTSVILGAIGLILGILSLALALRSPT